VYLPAGFNCCIICELYWITSRVQTCVIELLPVINSCIREPLLKLELVEVFAVIQESVIRVLCSRVVNCNQELCNEL
jgi:hypothetical protein